jgi:myosin heavy subunit
MDHIIEKLKVQQKGPEGVPNLLALDDLNEDTLLSNIEIRYADLNIYTTIGSSILISLNPYQKLPIYTTEKAKQCRHFVKDLRSGRVDESARPDPHLFMVAEEAYEDLIIDKQNQSIIVTGESGAGKTEATKIILSYLAK